MYVGDCFAIEEMMVHAEPECPIHFVHTPLEQHKVNLPL